MVLLTNSWQTPALDPSFVMRRLPGIKGIVKIGEMLPPIRGREEKSLSHFPVDPKGGFCFKRGCCYLVKTLTPKPFLHQKSLTPTASANAFAVCISAKPDPQKFEYPPLTPPVKWCIFLPAIPGRLGHLLNPF